MSTTDGVSLGERLTPKEGRGKGERRRKRRKDLTNHIGLVARFIESLLIEGVS